MEKAVVFGIGNYYKFKKKSIESKYEIIGFIDNRIAPGEEDITDGIVTVNPKDIARFPQVSIILMSVKFFEMWFTLIQMGVDENRIIFGITFEPIYDSFEQIFKANDYAFTSKNHQLILSNEKNKYYVKDSYELDSCIRDIYHNAYPVIDILRNFPLQPVSRRFGREHGTPIDRYYIEKFLEKNCDKIHGEVAEFAEDTYARRYGFDITHSYILHVNGWGERVIKVNLETGDGVREGILDCLICTQTIQFIFNLDAVIQNICKLLKNDGCALITCHGISQISLYDYRNWGEYWRFTPMTIKRLYEQNTENCEISVQSYGNVKTATAMLYGLCAEDLDDEDFEFNDEQYPLLLTVVIKKL